MQIYRDKIRADAVDDSLQNRRQNMQEYVKDWFLNRHGMPRLAQVPVVCAPLHICRRCELIRALLLLAPY